MSVLLSCDNGKNGTLKHRLVSYVMNHSKGLFYRYVWNVVTEMKNRNIKYQNKYLNEISIFTEGCSLPELCKNYPEHNQLYFVQCYYNLQEKYLRGIVSDKEWFKIQEVWDEQRK